MSVFLLQDVLLLRMRRVIPVNPDPTLFCVLPDPVWWSWLQPGTPQTLPALLTSAWSPCRRAEPPSPTSSSWKLPSTAPPSRSVLTLILTLTWSSGSVNTRDAELTVCLPSAQSEDALQATRLLLPPSPGSSAFLYNEELVFACSTGTSRGGPPDEKIAFNSPGERANRLHHRVSLKPGLSH